MTWAGISNEQVNKQYGTPNRESPKYVKQLLTDLKGEADSNTIITPH